MPSQSTPYSVAIIGGGPAGLMAAEVLSRNACRVDLYDAMPSLGRKFLMAGKGGMNITHTEPLPGFLARYGSRQEHIEPLLDAFGPEALREWIHGLGIETFVGSSGRVFPTEMKAAPLLRACLHRLRESGVRFHVRHRWERIEQHTDGAYTLHFSTPNGEQATTADAVLLALGGGSWSRLGSDGLWVATLAAMGVAVAPLRPANCGFNAHWSTHLRERFAGQPVKSVVASFTDDEGRTTQRQGEFIITRNGIEGGLIYALAAPLRDAIERHGAATLWLDLLPGHELQRVVDEVARPRASRSLSSHLQSRLGLKGVKSALLHECLPPETINNPLLLAHAIKALPLRMLSPRPLDEAISSAGGVRFEALDENLMIRHLPGVFCAGEMLDWEAPTGGYLLTGCFASGYAAGHSMSAWLKSGLKSEN